MCGISALLSLNDVRLSAAEIRDMTATVRHRGPDDEGFALFGDDGEPVLFGGEDTPDSVLGRASPYAPASRSLPAIGGRVRVALGHRRLSILDLSPAGHQPMCTSDRRYWIVYNGEVYNYRELRDELEAAGHTFSTGTDTEVVLHAYAEWGRDCLSRFNGMFAFVLLDREARTIFAARDRFGVKPLYYWFSPGGCLAFASEIKQFTVLPGWQARLNHQRAFDYLAYSFLDHTDETMFAGVMQLRGGQAVEARIDEIDGTLPVYRWYDFQPERSRLAYTDACARFRELFSDSVRLRLRADVSIGSCLSGGLDSSSIVCVANDLLRDPGPAEPQRTFSATSDVRRFDESDYIATVVEERGLEAHFTCPSVDDLLDQLDRIIWHQDEPFGSTSIYAQWSVFGLAARTGVKVMLDGQGADEQLAGYIAYQGTYLSTLARRGRLGRLVGEALGTLRHHRGFFANAARQLVVRRGRRGLLRVEAPPIHRYAGDLDHVLRRETVATNLPALLHYEDRNSMHFSIEARVPFLDYRVVEYLASLPLDQKLRHGVTKRVLRRAIRGIVPEAIRCRMDKMGFVTPEEVWMGRELAPLVEEVFASDSFRSRPYWDADAVAADFARFRAGKAEYSWEVFRIFVTELWLRLFFDERAATLAARMATSPK